MVISYNWKSEEVFYFVIYLIRIEFHLELTDKYGIKLIYYFIYFDQNSENLQYIYFLQLWKRWLIIKSKFKPKKNEYEINEKIAYLKISKKDNTSIDTKLDEEDLQKVLAKGTWFAEWNKDLNNFIVLTLEESVVDGKKTFHKQTLQALILDISTKAPIRHCNGNTLDNRKCNLEIYVPKSTNDYEEFNAEAYSIILRDKYGNLNAKTIIDKEDLQRVINYGYVWSIHKVNNEPYAVANTPGGRVFLNRFIMGTSENMNTHPINLNTLDNRKSNLKNVLIEEEE